MKTNGISPNGTTGTTDNGTSPNGAVALELHLSITDHDLCDKLSEYLEGPERNDFAISAMRIGAIALRQAEGQIDSDRVRQEGEHLISVMDQALSQHQQEVTRKIGDFLKLYFDSESGQFDKRVKALVGQDGELERAIRKQVEGSDSSLAQTLAAQVGQNSPLMQVLDVNANDGLLHQLKQSTEATLSAQRDRILSEFSKDNQDSAINRLVAELTNNHGEVGKALEERIDKVTGEFSLDNENSALSRLVGRVETAQRQISSEFDLNQDGSSLARLRKELLELLETQNRTNTDFQSEVKATLAAMSAKKEEAQKGTLHGSVFEDAVFSYISQQSQKAGDVAEHTGNTVGFIKNNRKGDAVVELGPESVAAGARIVIEAKEDASYNLKKAREELDAAKKNRGADIGIFVFSKRTSPDGLEFFNRFGNDIVVVWDAEDFASNVFLNAGLSVAKALSVRAKAHGEEVGADFEAIEKAVLEIEKQIGELGQITKWANTIKNNGEHILKSTEKVSDSLTQQISILNEKVGGLREAVGTETVS